MITYHHLFYHFILLIINPDIIHLHFKVLNNIDPLMRLEYFMNALFSAYNLQPWHMLLQFNLIIEGFDLINETFI